jgi:hypothetical protein
MLDQLRRRGIGRNGGAELEAAAARGGVGVAQAAEERVVRHHSQRLAAAVAAGYVGFDLSL